MAPSDDPPDVLAELRARLAVTEGLDDGEYVVVSTGSAGKAPLPAPASSDAGKAPVFILRTGLRLRSGMELTSELAGDGGIRAGARVHVLESATLDDCTERRCLSYEGHDEPLGWVTAFANGEPNLLTEAEALAAHAASLTRAVTGRMVETPVISLSILECWRVPRLCCLCDHSMWLSQKWLPSRLVFPQVPPSPSPQKSKKKLLNFGGGGEKCQKCGKTAYQAERAQIGNYYFHVGCLRCAECGPSKHLGSDYGLAANVDGVITLYCAAHEAEAKSKYPQTGNTQVTAERAGIAVLPAAAAAALPAAKPAAVPAAALAAVPAAVTEVDSSVESTVVPSPPPLSEALLADLRTDAMTSVAIPKVPAGLGTAADRALEESLKNSARASARAGAPSAVALEAPAATPFARCLQCFSADG